MSRLSSGGGAGSGAPTDRPQTTSQARESAPRRGAQAPRGNAAPGTRWGRRNPRAALPTQLPQADTGSGQRAGPRCPGRLPTSPSGLPPGRPGFRVTLFEGHGLGTSRNDHSRIERIPFAFRVPSGPAAGRAGWEGVRGGPSWQPRGVLGQVRSHRVPSAAFFFSFLRVFPDREWSAFESGVEATEPFCVNCQRFQWHGDCLPRFSPHSWLSQLSAKKPLNCIITVNRRDCPFLKDSFVVECSIKG